MKVAVMGGGNGSHTIASDLTLKGLTVNMFEMERFAGKMRDVFETREIEMTGVAGHGVAKLNMVTSDIARAVEGVEVIFLPLPGFTVSVYAGLLAPLLKEGQMVVLMPGTLSALEFRETARTKGLAADPIVAETGGLPFATRLIGPGRVQTFHIRSVCTLAAVPGNRGREVYEKLNSLYSLDLKDSVVETGLGHQGLPRRPG
jgi:opine dehydrogenase